MAKKKPMTAARLRARFKKDAVARRRLMRAAKELNAAILAFKKAGLKLAPRH